MIEIKSFASLFLTKDFSTNEYDFSIYSHINWLNNYEILNHKLSLKTQQLNKHVKIPTKSGATLNELQPQILV